MDKIDENNRLSRDDITALMQHPDTDHKVQIIEKLSSQYNAEDFSGSQKETAEEIFRLLMKQAEIEVRKSLADNLMSSKNIPHDVVLSLAKDVEEVALPMLEFSEVLTDEDLIDIVSTTEMVSSQIAVANRNNVSEPVSTALVDTDNAEVINDLMQNDKASISTQSYNKVLSNFADSEKIVESMITRGSLPNRIISQMTKKVSDNIQKKLENKYQYSFNDINTFFKESGEVAAHRFLGMQTVDPEVIDLVDTLEVEGKLEDALHPIHGGLTQLLDGLEQLGQLTPLSALTIGHMTLFEISIARLTGIPFANAVKLVHDEKGGLRALYDRAQLPPKLYDAVHFIVHIINRMEQDEKKGTGDRASDNLFLFMKNIVKESKGKRINNLAHFISMIKHHIDEKQSEW